jgi:sec-independent protein translocase protein TatA
MVDKIEEVEERNMFSFSMPELGVILVIALMVFGPSKLPEIGKSLGKSFTEFKQGVSGEDENKQAPVEVTPKQEVLQVEGKKAEQKIDK